MTWQYGAAAPPQRASIEVAPVAHGRVNRVSQPVYDGVLMTEISLGAGLPGTPVR
jgi:hypothetical protein